MRSIPVALVIGLAALTSCKSSGGAQEVEVIQREVGGPIQDIAESTQSPETQPYVGSLLITVRDQHGQGAEGIPVTIIGPRSVTLTSDKQGVINLEGPSGDYRFEIAAGCSGAVLIEFGGRGSGSIAAGQVGSGTLEVRWKHSVAPAGGSYPGTYPYWPIGENVDLTYDVIDRCMDDRAPNASFPTFRFEPSKTLKIVGDPAMKSDTNAFGLVTLQCVAKGIPKVVILDSKNPEDGVDLMAYDNWPGSFSQEIHCGSKF